MAPYTFPYLSPHQSRQREPTEWELNLADAIEGAFSKGAHELDALVAALNTSRVRPQGGGQWTSENFTALMHELGG
jgi:Recombinase-like helix-turn-helix domain